MAKAKGTKPAASAPAKRVRASRAKPPVQPEAASVAPAFKEFQFEGATVLGFVGSGDNDTHFHCRLSDGTTKHVPKELFQ